MARTSLRSRRRLFYECLLEGAIPCRQALLFCLKNPERKQKEICHVTDDHQGNYSVRSHPGTAGCLPGGYLVAEDGLIRGVYGSLPEQYAGAPVEDWGDALILQSFADLHLHAPSTPCWGWAWTCPCWSFSFAKLCQIICLDGITFSTLLNDSVTAYRSSHSTQFPFFLGSVELIQFFLSFIFIFNS